jgi:kynurenine 3-monooxygenase
MLQKNEQIVIIGAGLVGSLLSILLAQKNYAVKVYEKRPDPTKAQVEKGRSINLALSDRGIKTLDLAGIADKAMKLTIPMEGRLMHEPNGQLVLQPYGKEGQQIYSISRSELTNLLIEEAKALGVIFNFNVQLDKIDFSTKILHLTENNYNLSIKEPYQILFGADGAFSAVRNELKESDKLDFKITALEHSYKELHIPPTENNGHRIYKNALHIWPRKQFMLIALPNLDGSFTVTLFLPTKGDLSFEYLNNKENLESFFLEYFPDAYALIPDLVEQFYTNPTSFLGTVKSWPWILEDQIALIGDAAHAIVPFYGQGMNAGFEDCRILVELIAQNQETTWADILHKFQLVRKENTDAIADLAVANFYEMRDRVADENFLLRKKIETEIQKQYPEYLPLYSMVTFSHLPYSEAYLRGKKQEAFMDKVMNLEHLSANFQDEKHWKQIIEMGMNEGIILERN